MTWYIEAIDPDGYSYILEYTAANTPVGAFSKLRAALDNMDALLHPLADLRPVQVAAPQGEP